jgi:hypothetical protein
VRATVNLHEPPVHAAMAVGSDSHADYCTRQKQDDDE